MSNEVPVSTTFIFVDRRKTGRGKSLPNRQRLLRRIRDSIRAAKPDDIDAGGVGAASKSADKKLENPVKVARDALSEPTFRYARHSGELDLVLPGNDRWLKGDKFPLDSESEAEGGSGPGEDGEDDFVINISRSEFLDVFFEDCALPDMEQTSIKETPEAVRKPAGFQKEGTPGQLSVIRSYRNALGRRRALTLEDREQLEELQGRLDDLMISDLLRDSMPHEEWAAEVAEITKRIAEIKNRLANIPMFEKLDNRYRKTEKVMVKSAQATLIMAMDISASMQEEMKRQARRFFSLQYSFIRKKYPDTDLVFIYHTDEAEEVTEQEFFTSRKNGGTIISPAFALARKIIKERYDVTQTNIYFSYAGDGDNWPSDNHECEVEMIDRGLLSCLRHAVYIQVGDSMGWGGSGPNRFWATMELIQSKNKKLHLAKISKDDQVFTAFKSVYGTKGKK
jgi:uncharacterized protein